MIQPLVYIHPQAKIAETVVIEPFVTIYKDVVIGIEVVRFSTLVKTIVNAMLPDK